MKLIPHVFQETVFSYTCVISSDEQNLIIDAFRFGRINPERAIGLQHPVDEQNFVAVCTEGEKSLHSAQFGRQFGRGNEFTTHLSIDYLDPLVTALESLCKYARWFDEYDYALAKAVDAELEAAKRLK